MRADLRKKKRGIERTRMTRSYHLDLEICAGQKTSAKTKSKNIGLAEFKHTKRLRRI